MDWSALLLAVLMLYVLGWIADAIAVKFINERALVAMLYYDLKFVHWPFGMVVLILLTKLVGFKALPPYGKVIHK